MTPFWHSFDTEQIQSGETELPDFKKHTSDIEISESQGLTALKEKYADGTAIIDHYSKKGEWVQIWCDELWNIMGISEDSGEQTRIGEQLTALGVTRHQSTGGRRFYRIPPLSELDNNEG